MTLSLSPAVSRLAAVGLLLILLLLLLQHVLFPWLDARRARVDGLELIRDEISRYERLAASIPELKAQLAALSGAQEKTGQYLTGETEALASAELLDLAQATIERYGGRIRSTQQVSRGAEQGEVAVRIDFNGAMDVVQRSLYDLERGPPFLLVQELDIRSITKTQESGEVTAEPELVVSLTLAGLLEPKAEP